MAWPEKAGDTATHNLSAEIVSVTMLYEMKATETDSFSLQRWCICRMSGVPSVGMIPQEPRKFKISLREKPQGERHGGGSGLSGAATTQVFTPLRCSGVLGSSCLRFKVPRQCLPCWPQVTSSFLKVSAKELIWVKEHLLTLPASLEVRAITWISSV